MASTAAPSPPFLSPRPTQRAAAIAAASVTRTSSSARLRSGACWLTASSGGTEPDGAGSVTSVRPFSTSAAILRRLDEQNLSLGGGRPTNRGGRCRRLPPPGWRAGRCAGDHEGVTRPPDPAARQRLRTPANLWRALIPLLVIVGLV